jgi:hypothetical protein
MFPIFLQLKNQAYSLLGYEIMQFGTYLPTFRTTVQFHISGIHFNSSLIYCLIRRLATNVKKNLSSTLIYLQFNS